MIITRDIFWILFEFNYLVKVKSYGGVFTSHLYRLSKISRLKSSVLVNKISLLIFEIFKKSIFFLNLLNSNRKRLWLFDSLISFFCLFEFKISNYWTKNAIYQIFSYNLLLFGIKNDHWAFTKYASKIVFYQTKRRI